MLRFFFVSKMQHSVLIFAYAIALTRAAKRDILRAAVFLCTTPFVTPRINSGSSLLGLYLPSDWFPPLG